MAFIDYTAYVAYFNALKGTHLHILSALPTTYANVTAYSLGYVTPVSYTFEYPGTGVGGYLQSLDGHSGGTVTATGTATHWAITNLVKVFVSGALDSPQQVYVGGTFSCDVFDIELPYPVSV